MRKKNASVSLLFRAKSKASGERDTVTWKELKSNSYPRSDSAPCLAEQYFRAFMGLFGIM